MAKRTFNLLKFPPSLSVMDRYLASELIAPFLFGMGLFTALMIAIGTGFDLVRKVAESGLLVPIALKVMLLRLPGFIVYAFPMSVLLATLIVYSRLSSDSELVALRSIGVTLYRIVVPAIVMSLLISGIAFIVNDWIAPTGNYQAAITLETALDRVKPKFEEHNILYPEYREIEDEEGDKRPVLSRLFYAEEFNGEKMVNLTIIDRSREGFSQIITAQAAAWNISKNIWDFFNGTIYLIKADGSFENIVRFHHHQLALPREPLDVAKRRRDFSEMNFAQAREALQIAQLSGSERDVRKLEVRIQEKIAFPFICLVFGLIGAVLGLRPQNTGRATSFGICVGLIFSYYLLSFLTSSLGVMGTITPVMAAWLPNVLGLATGGWLLVRSSAS